jgi:hypothetical protein
MNWKPGAFLGLLLFFGTVGPAFAHGAKIVYTIDVTVNLQAMYDTGEPRSIHALADRDVR